jgi:4-amino-4-deoxychorismate lyase
MHAQSPLRAGESRDFELIETFRYEPERGFIRLERHLARMAASASELGFSFSKDSARALLRSAGPSDEPLRIRMSLNAVGKLDLSSAPFNLQPSETIWRLRIAAARLDSADSLLRHKTSRREAYDLARAQFAQNDADEVLMLNEKSEVCEGTITTVFVQGKDGSLVTPHLASGLLQGVLRQELLDIGKAREARLTINDLAGAQALFMGNSLRGLIRARLIE